MSIDPYTGRHVSDKPEGTMNEVPDVTCADCGMPYGGTSWIDVVVDDSVWRQIAPQSNGQGILCVHCISRRLCDLSLSDVPAYIASGPLVNATGINGIPILETIGNKIVTAFAFTKSILIISEKYDALAAEAAGLKKQVETQQKRITQLENALTLSYQSRWQVERRLGDLVCAAEARVSRTHKRWVKLR
ncbi:hypothetical protein M0R72_14610, partial [Candidatus Pacearchaeota archaeon]|nr:hypothetical protein [Candidatus Pacearchaeota archaeon]